MKSSKIIFATAAIAVALSSLPALATPRAAAPAGKNFPVAAEDLSGWYIGGFYRYQDRELDNSDDLSLNQNKFAMHIGRDVFSWFTLYGFIGPSDAKIDSPYFASEDTDSTLEWGFGAALNLLEQDIIGNLMLETRFSIQAMAQVSFFSPEINGTEIDCADWYAALTFNLINDVIGNKEMWPNAIGLFFGPVWSHLETDDDDVLNLTGSEVGLLVGLDFYLTRSCILSCSFETYESDIAMCAALNLRF